MRRSALREAPEAIETFAITTALEMMESLRTAARHFETLVQLSAPVGASDFGDWARRTADRTVRRHTESLVSQLVEMAREVASEDPPDESGWKWVDRSDPRFELSVTMLRHMNGGRGLLRESAVLDPDAVWTTDLAGRSLEEAGWSTKSQYRTNVISNLMSTLANEEFFERVERGVYKLRDDAGIWVPDATYKKLSTLLGLDPRATDDVPAIGSTHNQTEKVSHGAIPPSTAGW
ncbi:hypothetical protein [Embleya sp. NPDC050493]|uniref:hypothetical protein n=1 Tax=Embleya sp. NPDC050493 TaxID=3363989 RepID=UPI0037B808CD